MDVPIPWLQFDPPIYIGKHFLAVSGLVSYPFDFIGFTVGSGSTFKSSSIWSISSSLVFLRDLLLEVESFAYFLSLGQYLVSTSSKRS